MDRDKATRILERVVAAAESSAFPARVTAIYVFGSFARGALHPHDLDLILIHDRPSKPLMDRLQAELRRKRGPNDLAWRTTPKSKFQCLMRKAMRQPGAAMDVLFAESLREAITVWSKVAKSERSLVWSEKSRNWRRHLSRIKTNEAACRFERGHFANIRLFRCDVSMMEQVSEALRQGKLVLTRIPVNAIKLDLNSTYQHWLDHWRTCKLMGRESTKLLPYGMWWMQHQKGQKSKPPNAPFNGAMFSRDWKYVVYFGRPLLYSVFRVAQDSRRLRICLIPHLRRDQPNELFVFERGPRSNKDNRIARTS